MNDLILSSPLWVLFLFSLIPLSLKVLNKNREYSVFVSACVTLLGIFASLFLLCLICWLRLENGEGEEEVTLHLFSSALVLDKSRVWAAGVLLLIGAVTILMSLRHPQMDQDRFSEILFLLSGSLIGLLVLLWSGHLLVAFIGLEMASLVFYLLIALGRTGSQALKASFKYFVLGSVASAILLYGICFVLGSVGHFDLQSVLQENPELILRSRLLVLAVMFIMVGFLFKISIFPFHFWLPDVYRGSSSPLLVFMATGLKLTVFVLIFEWTKNIFTQIHFPSLISLFQWLAVLSVLFGNIIALLQKDFKKMLLFSTVAHSGYLFMILIASQMGFSMGKMALFYYLIVYISMILGIFICLRPFERENQVSLNINELAGLSRRKPFHALLITLFLLSLAGVPPTGGFIAKLFLFQSLLDQGFWWMLFWTIIGSSIAFFYYLKPIAFMYMKQSLPGEAEPVSKEKAFCLPRFLSPVLWLLAGLVLVSGLAPSFFYFH